MGGRSTPLGVRAARRRAAEATLELATRATGSCSTPTGSSSAARESIDDGLERLLAAVRGRRRPEALARALEEDGRGDDDV